MTPAIETVEALDEMRASVLFDGGISGIPMRVCISFARAIRQADERAGLVTVPRQVTQQIIAADTGDGWIIKDQEEWAALLAASPFASAAQGEGGE